MKLNDIKLVRGMTKLEVNELIKGYMLLEDEIFKGVGYSHNWKCKCGNPINNRRLSNIRSVESTKCNSCRYNQIEKRYRYEVEKDGEYEYIRSFKTGDTLPNGKFIKKGQYLQVKHKYCKSIYIISSDGFVNQGNRCPNCCHKYENSFAYHIEVELGESLEKYWDFEKNTVNPYHISKNHNGKVWIKCQEKDYHGSYEISCNKFITGNRCPYCSSRKTHRLDSFGQWLKNEGVFHLWSDKNKIDPYTISRSNGKKVWMVCDTIDYHKDYKIKCCSFYNGNRCNYCSGHNIHLLDSFGQYLKDNNLLHLWSDKNIVDPFTLARSSGKKVYMLCDEVDYHNDYGGYEVRCIEFTKGHRCSYCGCHKVHPKDSFAVKYPDKAKCWHEDNDKSPYEVSWGSSKRFKFRCDKCNYVWSALISKVGKGQRWCPNCASSKGEKRIKEYLDKNNIEYIHDKEYFKDLLGVGGLPLRPDFILPEHKIWIEYDGEFHFKKIYNDDNYEILKEHDKRKNKYAEDSGWKMVRIPYTKFDEIETILNKELKL